MDDTDTKHASWNYRYGRVENGVAPQTANDKRRIAPGMSDYRRNLPEVKVGEWTEAGAVYMSVDKKYRESIPSGREPWNSLGITSCEWNYDNTLDFVLS